MTNLGITQNFIKSPELVLGLLSYADIKPEDTVIDIGAGEGIITECLAEKCAKVISVEFDKNLFGGLYTKFSKNEHVELRNEDFLQMRLPDKEYKVFANIPFNITSQIVEKLVFSKNTPKSAYLIMQKEAAQRFMGESEGYLIHHLISPFYTMSIALEINAEEFSPVPSVDPVLFSMVKNADSTSQRIDRILYNDFVTFIFFQQKPTLKKRLADIFTYDQMKRISKDLKIDFLQPASRLTNRQVLELFYIYTKYVEPKKKALMKGAFVDYTYNKIHEKKVTRTKLKLPSRS